MLIYRNSSSKNVIGEINKNGVFNIISYRYNRYLIANSNINRIHEQCKQIVDTYLTDGTCFSFTYPLEKEEDVYLGNFSGQRKYGTDILLRKNKDFSIVYENVDLCYTIDNFFIFKTPLYNKIKIGDSVAYHIHDIVRTDIEEKTITNVQEPFVFRNGYMQLFQINDKFYFLIHHQFSFDEYSSFVVVETNYDSYKKIIQWTKDIESSEHDIDKYSISYFAYEKRLKLEDYSNDSSKNFLVDVITQFVFS